MKRIDIKCVVSPNGHSLKIDENRWRVILGYETEISFKNQKHAIAFQARINEELNDILITYNDISIELYRHYKTNWFYFNMNRQQIDTESRIRYAFSEVERLMDKVFKEYDHFRIIAYVGQIAENLKNVASGLQSLQRHRECYSEVRSLELIKMRITFNFETIEGFGWNPVPPGGEIVRCEAMQKLKVKEQLKSMMETVHRRSLKN